MKHTSKTTIWWLILCACTTLAAQDSTPGSKTEPTPQQSPAPEPRRIIVRVTPTSESPQAKVVKRVQAQYPQEAREAHIQGRVVLKVKINLEGDVSKVDLISGHPMLVAAAIDAVKQWKYQRFMLNGQPAERETEAVVDFSLQPAEGHAGAADSPPAPNTGATREVPDGIPSAQNGGAIGGIVSPQRVRVSQQVSNGLVVKRAFPQYPPEARKGRIQGAVVMHAIISKAGDIEMIELVSGDPLLSPAAIDAVKQWKYKPYLLDGKPVEVDTQIQVNFTLSGN